jgi:hypothetical protein
MTHDRAPESAKIGNRADIRAKILGYWFSLSITGRSLERATTCLLETFRLKTIYLLRYLPPTNGAAVRRSDSTACIAPFRRRTRSNPCSFNEFLKALQSSETVRDVICCSQLHLGIVEDEWVLLVKTIGSVKYIQNLILRCRTGYRDSHPFQAVARAVNNAQLLRKLVIFRLGILS